MTYPLVRDLAAEGIPVRLTCGVLGFSTQGHYAWLSNPVSDRDLQDAYLTNVLLDAHGDDPAFGYRFLADELETRRDQRRGAPGLEAVLAAEGSGPPPCARAAAAVASPGPAVFDDHVQRDFTAAAPNLRWLTDITEHPTDEGKVYCCAIKDLFANRIVGYAIGERMTADPAVAALRAAIARRQPDGVVVVHADRGS